MEGYIEEKERVVTLEGETFFEVSHNSQQSFVVKTGKGQTKVLGTGSSQFHQYDAKGTGQAY